MAAEFVQRGRSFVEQGQLQEAVRVCRLGLLANPGEIEGRLVLGSALMALARYDEVLAEMQNALAMESMNPSALALKGEALLRKGEAVQAQSVLEQASQVALGDPYVEALQAEAAAAAISAPAPYETVDIDPELEGVEIHDEEAPALALPVHEDASSHQGQSPHPGLNPNLNPALNPGANPAFDPRAISESGIELLDNDLLDEATPTPMPVTDNLDDDALTMEAPKGLVDRLDSIERLESFERLESQDIEEVEQPFEDHWDKPMGKSLVDSDIPTGIARGVIGRPETVGTLFPEDESGVSGLELVASPHAPYEAAPIDMDSPPGGVGRAMTADMDLIRGGFDPGQPVGSPRRTGPRAVSIASQAPLEPRREDRVEPRPKGRRQIPTAVWLLLFLASVGGGLFGGLKLREQRILAQVDQVKSDAKELAASDTYLGYKQARDLYGRIDKFRGDDPSQSALARSEAALAAEFGHSPAAGAALLAKIGDKSRLDALVAGAYIAIAKGNHSDAAEKATQITASYAGDPIGHYLLGRAKILAEDPEAALLSIDKALELGASPLVYVAQARAEALQGRYNEALAAVAKAIEGNEANPAGVIWQARILLQSGELPKNPSDPDDLLKELIARSRSQKLSANSLSSAQGAWAGLVLAEIKLHRGDNAGADQVLAEAKVNRPSDWLFSEMLSDILIRLGKFKEAGIEATKASKTWPGLAKPRITLGLVALLDGDPEGAIEILEEIDDVESLAEALVVRGRANLTLGLLDKAVTDLDNALSMRSRDSDAVIARAKVDILRGDPKSAISRLEPMYDRTAGPNLAIAYATALRTTGKTTQARSVLAPLVGDDGSVKAFIELAALEQHEGNFEKARAAFQRAIAVDSSSQYARLGAALLDLEDGKIDAGRVALDALVAEGTENGQILVEAARARTWTGDAESAKILLERTSKSSSWLNWKVARESGRINLRRKKLNDAIDDLLRAQSLRPTDTDTRLLLMEAYLEARDKKGATRALQDVTKSFADSPVRSMAAGMHALLNENPTDAESSFIQARSLLIDLNASDLEQARVAYWLGRTLEVTGDLGGATDWFDKAIDFNESHAAAYFWLGQVQIRDNKTKKMVASYKKAMEIDPTFNSVAWYFLGYQYEAEGKKDLAAKALNSFLEHYHEDSGDLVIDAKSLLARVR